ncbi:type IV pilus modification protein PilV [Noviherbaspirillum aridicola]|uniref:Type IV pilus assembly protein PilV n=1 Tax=Noviherbaspirillum aridicola TaxID=2849687 RepID=A0ABQ4QAP6_9BURK|nr:type IV pilus modification protein PilV [Noviherbaspirillum aridicola]GIZ53870.1 hypothetical protein NCCP691_38840 [Noviherbaspirillum aridicola]
MLSSTFRIRQHGVTLIEVLVTIVILAFGLLGLAGLQSKLNVGTLESYQRAQAVVLLNNMAERINANRANAGDYVTDETLGTGDSQPASCAALAGAERDLCEWSLALKGAAEKQGADETNVGAMVGARGCITEVQAPSTTPGACAPGIYQVAVAWQGLHATRAPSVTCGSGNYGEETSRRAISVQVAIGLPGCK